jgi:NAD(P)H-dependent FMN reductase
VIWTLFNGSPRGRRSNTGLLLDQLSAGLADGGDAVGERHHLVLEKDLARAAEAFARAEGAVIAFPLYADSMPGVVKAFFEALAPLRGRPLPKVLFLVQSGFPEACHCRPLEGWLALLARRLGCVHAGTIVRGGVEGIQVQPPWMTKGLYGRVRALGASVAREGRLDPAILRELAGRERFRGPGLLVARVALRMSQGFWDHQLKKNGAYERRFAAPYPARLDPIDARSPSGS